MAIKALHSSKEAAEKSPTTHRLVLGRGYVNIGKEPAIKEIDKKEQRNCAPPPNTLNATTHLLSPPGNGTPVIMRWLSMQKAWASILPFQGNRMAWTADYLSRAGWAYMRPQSLDVKKAG